MQHNQREGASPRVASTAQIHATARLGPGVEVGHFCVIEAGVAIGAETQVGHHVVVRAGTQIGSGCRVDDHAVVGKRPMKAAASATTQAAMPPPAVIGARCLIGAGVVLYAGCSIADDVLVADLATVREDVQVGPRTIVGRGVAIENHCRIGARCKLETNAYLCAYSTLDDDCFVAPGVLTSNDNFMGRDPARFAHFQGVTVEQGGRLGVGAVVLPGRVIHTEGVVAAGGVATRDVPSFEIVAGVPATPFRPVPDAQRLEPPS